MSPLSGGGRGIAALMSEALAVPSFVGSDGQPVPGPSMGQVIRLPYLGVGSRPGNTVGMPDTELIYHATGRDCATVLALVPCLLRYSLGLGAAMVAWSGPLRAPLLAATTMAMWILRRVLLARVSSSVQVTATGGGQHRMLSVPDGQRATALALAAMVACWRNGSRTEGMVTAAEVFSLDEVIAQMRALDEMRVETSWD